jgi:hypothetical protein
MRKRIAGNDANVYNSFNGQRVVGNENSAIIGYVRNEMLVFPLAERHCKKYGPSPRIGIDRRSEGGHGRVIGRPRGCELSLAQKLGSCSTVLSRISCGALLIDGQLSSRASRERLGAL